MANPLQDSSPNVTIRIYREGDHRAIGEIFSAAVHQIASEYYTKEQCLAWASEEVNYDHWERRCQLKRPFVALIGQSIAGFLELDPDGHIDCTYANPAFKRQGVASRLVTHAKEICFSFGLVRMYVEASICAKPLFEKHGFLTVCDNLVTINGVDLINYKMELLQRNTP